MRHLLIVSAAVVLMGAAQSTEPPRAPEAQAKLDKLLEGRVAGETRSCVPTSVVTNAIGIDDHTLLFRDGPRIWRTELRASFECARLGRQSFIHTESATNRICSGAQLEFDDGNITGACVLGSFTVYKKP